MLLCYRLGVMNGISDTTFDAFGDYTVEQSLVTMDRMCSQAYNHMGVGLYD